MSILAMSSLSLLSAVLVAGIAPLGAYLLAVHRMSGKVDTSTATELWTEARAIRHDYREQLALAGDRTRQLEERVARLEGQNNVLVTENQALRTKVFELEALVSTLRETISKLQDTIKTLEAAA